MKSCFKCFYKLFDKSVQPIKTAENKDFVRVATEHPFTLQRSATSEMPSTRQNLSLQRSRTVFARYVTESIFNPSEVEELYGGDFRLNSYAASSIECHDEANSVLKEEVVRVCSGKAL